MYPQSNSARSVRDLSGVWDFRFNANEPWQPIAVQIGRASCRERV